MDKKKALKFLDGLASGISEMFGENCETLVHDMSVPKHPIIIIYNGHVSNRELGSTIDIYGNKASDRDVYLDDDFVNHMVISKTGRRLKSSTFHYRGDEYHYALGINYNFTYMYDYFKSQKNFMKVESDLDHAIAEVGDNRLSSVFDLCVKKIGKDIEEMNRSDRVKLVELLKKEKASNYKKFVPYVSERLNLSRYTIYKYIKEVDENLSE